MQCVASRQAAKDLIGPVRLKLANYSTELLLKDLDSIEVFCHNFIWPN